MSGAETATGIYGGKTSDDLQIVLLLITKKQVAVLLLLARLEVPRTEYSNQKTPPP